MQFALYEPGMGYYSAGARKFGIAGDFITAPEISSLFSACLGQVAADYLAANPAARVLEIGAGTGAMAAVVMRTLSRRGALPGRYSILEISGDLRARQRTYLQAEVPEHFDRFEWLDDFPGEPVDSLVLANEVLDALPFDRFMVDQGRVFSLDVTWDEAAGLQWCQNDAPDRLQRVAKELMSTAGPWPSPYRSEINTSLSPWLNSLSDSLRQGLVLFVDYGLPRREYYFPSRREGTLACHYRHRVHENPFFFPGLQDITAWVDFTAVAEVCDAAGMELAAYTTQAQFLLAANIESLVVQTTDEIERVRAAKALRTLMMPGEMGENFKVMALIKGSVEPPQSVGGRDLRHLL